MGVRGGGGREGWGWGVWGRGAQLVGAQQLSGPINKKKTQQIAQSKQPFTMYVQTDKRLPH